MTSIINNAFEAVKTAANHGEQVKALNALKVTELRELAKWQSIRLTGKTRKADIIEAVIDGMRQNVIHFMENAMLGTRKSLNITRENLNENLNSAYLDNGYSFTPETIKTFAKAFYNIELGQGDALDLTREFLTKINSKIFKLVAHFDELDEAEAVVDEFENKQSKEEPRVVSRPLTEEITDEVAERVNAQEDAAEVKSEAKLAACESFSEVINFVKENKLTANEFYALADKSMQGLERKGLYEMAVYYCEAHDLLLDTKKPYMARIDELFDELVPSSGAADSLAGELVRAVSRIGYRYYNDGDWLGIDGGRETVNPAGRFLRKYGDKNIADIIKALWTDINERDYERHLSRLVFYVVNYIEANDNFKNLKTETIDDCRDPEQDFDDEESSYDAERCEYVYEFKPFDLESLKGGEIFNLFTRYNKIKEQYPSTLMLFKTGDYYKSYDRDAEITAKVLDIALHDVRQPGKLMRAEIPAHAIDFYTRALNKRGFKTVVFEKSLEEVIAQEAEAA
ncbi:MAG: hypothetical protein IJP56_02140 [Synergistaceae bacterium]|nr:hypothetical protein [Synergistaceae bacterium]